MSKPLSDTNLASLALTHVYYDPDDILGLPSAFLALLPQALIIAYVVAIFVRREAETCHALVGQLLCEALNWILKRFFKQSRPQHVIGVGKGYGMPSSHSQFMGFIAAYAVLWLFIRNAQMEKWKKLFLSSCVVCIALAVCASRVYLAYHTLTQVLVGVSIGAQLGCLWFMFYQKLQSLGIIDWLLDTRIAQYFYMKDTHMYVSLEMEWKAWQDRRSRQKKRV